MSPDNIEPQTSGQTDQLPRMGSRDTSAGDSPLLTIAERWTTSGFVIGDPAVHIAGTDDYDVASRRALPPPPR
jgi:hypothetical protein